jgi:hypothetical protein
MADYQEAWTHCRYHFGWPTTVRRVQLTHCPASGEWQRPTWVCSICLEHYLRGHFRYVRPKRRKG